MRKTTWILAMLLIAAPLARAQSAATATSRATSQPIYSECQASPDGIGQVYMGREIAQVMGHLAADWLERPEREREEQPRILLENLPLKETDTVADIGAGTGYFSFRL